MRALFAPLRPRRRDLTLFLPLHSNSVKIDLYFFNTDFHRMFMLSRHEQNTGFPAASFGSVLSLPVTGPSPQEKL